jgi:hypothetical protein
MSEEAKTETVAPKKEELIDTVMRVMKDKYNWKLFVGFALGWLVAMYI